MADLIARGMANRVLIESQKLITPERTTFAGGSINVIKVDSLYSKGTLDYTTGAVTTNTSEYVTSKINVENYRNKYIVSAIPSKITVFDSNNNVISTFANLNGSASRKILSNASYMILGCTGNNPNIVKFFDTAQTSVTTIPYEEPTVTFGSNVFIPYAQVLNQPADLGKVKMSSNDFYRTLFSTVIAIGDSITEGYREAINAGYKAKSYPAYLARMANWTVENAGVSGATTTYWWTNKVATYTYTNYDVAIIKLGQNGGLTDTLTADTSGAGYANYANTNTGDYCKIIEYIKEKNPNIKIFLVPIQDTTDTVTNGVIQQIATKYNLPYLDISNNGIFTLTDSNKYHTYGATSYGVHFNTVGYLTLAKVIYMMMMENINNNIVNYQGY